jgi:hypothetical protein
VLTDPDKLVAGLMAFLRNSDAADSAASGHR